MVSRPLLADGDVISNGGGKARAAPLKFRYLFLLAVVSAASFLLLTISNGTEILFLNTQQIPTTWYTPDYVEDPSDNSFTIKTEGCTIPGLQPNDPSIAKYIKKPESLKPCSSNNTPIISSNRSHIWIDWDNFQYNKTLYYLAKDTIIICCYKPFFRPISVADVGSSKVDDRVEYKECSNFTDYIEVTDEFVRVSCFADNVTIHDQFLLFATEKTLQSNYDSTPLQNKTSAYNVIVIGLDAISRLNFHRTMPKTLGFLKNRGAIEMLGYNKVGDNTFPNVIPMLLGVRDTELNKTCWHNFHSTFDNCPFVWEGFKAQGFYTAFAEDAANLGTFNYVKTGFIGTPTDYYLRTFQYEAENQAGENRDFNAFLCMGGKYFYRVLLDYIDNLTTTLQTSKLFGFFWEVTMSHDYLNYPMAIDDSYTMFLRNLEEKEYLDDTILFILSDHGIRWGGIRQTKQGRLEERLPLMLVLTPPSFREKYSRAYENLKTNSRRLITPFDIHETLADLTNLNYLLDEEIQIKTSGLYQRNRGISLFLPVSANRTCKQAGIEDHWCTCHSGKKLPLDSKEAGEAAKHMMIELNGLVHGRAECARLSLDELISVQEMAAGEPEKGEVGWREYLVVLRTEPGGGVFEGTLRNGSHVPGAWTLAGSVSRLNLYGDQSRCVHDFRLKLYCYCIS